MPALSDRTWIFQNRLHRVFPVSRVLCFLLCILTSLSIQAAVDCQKNPLQPTCYLPDIDKEIQVIHNKKVAFLLQGWLNLAYVVAANQALNENDPMLAEELIGKSGTGNARDGFLSSLILYWLKKGKVDKAIKLISQMETPWEIRNITRVIKGSRGMDALLVENIVRAYERTFERIDDFEKRVSLYDLLVRLLERSQYPEIARAIDELMQSLVMQDPARISTYMRKRMIRRSCTRGDFLSAYAMAESFEKRKDKMSMLKWVAIKQLTKDGVISSPFRFESDTKAEITLETRLASIPKTASPEEVSALVQEMLEQVRDITDGNSRNRYYSNLAALLGRKGLYEEALRINKQINNSMVRTEQLYRTLRKLFRKKGLNAALEMASRINSQEAELFIYIFASEKKSRGDESRQDTDYLQKIESLIETSANMDPGIKAFGKLFLVKSYMAMKKDQKAIGSLEDMQENLDELLASEGYAEFVIRSVADMYIKLNRRDKASEYLARVRERVSHLTDPEKVVKIKDSLDKAERSIQLLVPSQKTTDIRTALEGDGKGLGIALSALYRRLDTRGERDDALTELLELVPVLSQKGFHNHVKYAMQRLAKTGAVNSDVIRLLAYVDDRKARNRIFRLMVEGFATRGDATGFSKLLSGYSGKQKMEYLVWAMEVIATQRKNSTILVKNFYRELWKKLSDLRGKNKSGDFYFAHALRQTRFFLKTFRDPVMENLMAKMISDPTGRITSEIAIMIEQQLNGEKAMSFPDRLMLLQMQKIKRPAWRAYAMLLLYAPFAVGPDWERDWLKAITE